MKDWSEKKESPPRTPKTKLFRFEKKGEGGWMPAQDRIVRLVFIGLVIGFWHLPPVARHTDAITKAVLKASLHI
jgi:hypothetical protein